MVRRRRGRALGRIALPYGPLFLLIAQTVWFATGGSPELGILAFRALAVLGVVLMVIYIPRLAAAFGARPAWAVWLCVLNPLSLIVFLPAAHNDPLMIGLMLAGAWYSLKRRRLAAVLLVTAAVAVKPIAMVVLPFVILLALPDTRSYRLRVREWAFAGSLAGALLVAGGWRSAWGSAGSPRRCPPEPPCCRAHQWDCSASASASSRPWSATLTPTRSQ